MKLHMELHDMDLDTALRVIEAVAGSSVLVTTEPQVESDVLTAPPPAPDEAPTLEYLRDTMKEFAAKRGSGVIVELLSQMGVRHVSDLDKSDWGTFLKKLEEA